MEELSQFFEHNFQIHEETDTNEPSNVSRIIYTNINQSDTNKATEKMLASIEVLTNSIRKLNLKENDTNLVFKLCGNLTKTLNELNLKLIEDNNGMTVPQVLETTTDLVRSKIFQFDSAYKRNENTLSNRFYVAPKDTAIGTRWEMKKMKKSGIILQIPRLIQTTFQYVSILETIKSLFEHDEFRDLYFQHNIRETDHICEPGKYKYFCCGNNFKNCELFQQHPASLQLQIASDDFEVCNPLSSKANRHKVCAVYFTIQNLPQKFRSKVNNIYLICLCNSDDVKMKHTDFNNIWQLIKTEVSHLETNGINIGRDTNLKGTITQVAFDNLGANTALGFVCSFGSNNFCRHCESSKNECQSMSRENINTIRTKESYDNQISIVNESVKVKYDETKGVKYYCKLSDLKYFHIVDNPTADIMHDICEGTIPFALKVLFNFCFKSELFTPEELNSMIQFFDYGFLNRKNLPSAVQFEKRSLGQNASQSLCLFRQVPFILYRYHTQLNKIWPCMESLLRVVEIMYSYVITENDLEILNEMIFSHLEELKKHDSKLNFIPKHHFSLHYARMIRSNGPLIHMNMINYERKHKVLKDIANSTHNFKNINKTLAVKHQSLMCTKGFTYVDDIQHGITGSLTDEFVSTYEDILTNTFQEVSNVNQTKWLQINNYEYRKNLFIVHESSLYNICNILIYENRYVFLCKKFDIVSFNQFLNSFKIEESMSYILVKHCDLKNKKTYDSKLIESDQYVIAESLELRNELHILE